MYWICKELLTLLQDMTYFSVTDFEENRFLILEKIIYDFEENRFLIWENHNLILEKIVFWFWRKSFSGFFYDLFKHDLLSSFAYEKNCEEVVCKSRDFSTIFDTIYSTIVLVIGMSWFSRQFHMQYPSVLSWFNFCKSLEMGKVCAK